MPRRLLQNTEFIVFVVIVILAFIIGAINPAFFSLRNFFDLLRSSIVAGIFALGVLMVIVSGGIDVSFTAIAVFSLYVTTKVMIDTHYTGPFWPAFISAALIGLLLGLFNAFLIYRFKLPTLIVTLGTQALYRGFLLFVIGSRLLRNIPDAMTDYSRSTLLSIPLADGSSANLPMAFLLLVAVIIVVFIIMKYTMLGRGIYALGGAPEAAARAGFNIRNTQFFIYGFVGFISGIAGMTYGALNRQANPFDIVGSELDVIAAVVLGGAAITGGRGSVVGTLLGVFLVVMMNNSLILVGIPSVWQKVVIGLVIIFGTGLSAIQMRNAARQRQPITEGAES